MLHRFRLSAAAIRTDAVSRGREPVATRGKSCRAHACGQASSCERRGGSARPTTSRRRRVTRCRRARPYERTSEPQPLTAHDSCGVRWRATASDSNQVASEPRACKVCPTNEYEVPARLRGDMATVWAYAVGAWSKSPASGWSHTISMRGISDLVASLSAAKLNRRVTQLAIVAHGDAPGQVVLDHKLTASNVANSSAILKRLGGYLTSDGMLTFYSCIAGRGDEGSQLLVALSNQLRGCTIVGFELYGLIGPSGAPNLPGRMTATDASDAQGAMSTKYQHGNLSPWCPFAKRARDGQIVHYPVLEQNGRPNKRCANPTCPGHSDPHHSCQGW